MQPEPQLRNVILCVIKTVRLCKYTDWVYNNKKTDKQ